MMYSRPAMFSIHRLEGGLAQVLTWLGSQHRFVQPFLLGLLTVGGLETGLVPSFSMGAAPHLEWSTTVLAQTVAEDEVKNYARAVLAIEPIRQAAYNEIKKITTTGDVPAIMCHRKDSLAALPSNIRSIAVNYCNQSKKIVESNGLAIARFNTITVNIQSDSDLEKRIQAELVRLQRTATPTPSPSATP